MVDDAAYAAITSVSRPQQRAATSQADSGSRSSLGVTWPRCRTYAGASRS